MVFGSRSQKISLSFQASTRKGGSSRDSVCFLEICDVQLTCGQNANGPRLRGPLRKTVQDQAISVTRSAIDLRTLAAPFSQSPSAAR